ncbi:MAG TPA: PilZ domain-containing protein [Thermoanaerobaculia bacterium]|nr:PilZ domain-containing protein [Thermoanaerobaculia bacterium]
MVTERRRFLRVKLREPLRGAVGSARVYVLDASVGGMRVAHQGTLPPPGAFCRVELPTDMGTIKIDCEVVRTVPQPPPLTQTQRPIFHSGLAVIAAADHQSAERLKTVFAKLPSDPENEH